MKGILYILLLISFSLQAQPPGQIKKMRPGKIVAVAVTITPAAPTTPVVNDVLDTYSVTLTPTYGTTDHEYTLNGGSSTTTLTSLPVSVGDVAKAIGQVGIRVKAATGRNASAWTFNASAFTEAEEEGLTVIDATTYDLEDLATTFANTSVILDFQGETITSSDNAYLWGIKNIYVRNATFVNPESGGVYEGRFPLYFGDIWRLNPRRVGYADNANAGIRIATVSIGSSTVTTTETNTLVAGDRIVIMDNERQMAGWPPNFENFEFNTVVSSVGSTVTLSTPTKFKYHSDQKDWGGFISERPDIYFGKARIYKINHLPITAKFENCHFPNNNTAVTICATDVTLLNCTAGMQVYPTSSKTFTITGGTYGNIEIDKAVELITLDNVDADRIDAATGALEVRVTNGTYLSQPSQVSPRKLVVENSTATAAMIGGNAAAAFQIYPWFFHTDEVSFQNVTFAKTVDWSGTDYVQYYWGTFSFTPTLSGSFLYIPDSDDVNDPAPLAPYRALGIGSRITANNGATAIIKDKFFDEANDRFGFELMNTTGTITGGLVWSGRQTDNIIDLGGNELSNGTPIDVGEDLP